MSIRRSGADDRRRRAYLRFCKEGDEEAVRAYLEAHGVDEEALRITIMSGQTDVLSLFVNSDISMHESLVHESCDARSVGSMEVLLAAGTNVNERRRLGSIYAESFLPGATAMDDPLGITALGYACMNVQSHGPYHAQLLVTYGAKRGLAVHDPLAMQEGAPTTRTIDLGNGDSVTVPYTGRIAIDAEGVAGIRLGHNSFLFNWLLKSRKWTLLDHLSHFLPPNLARAFLRHGADVAPVPSQTHRALICDTYPFGSHCSSYHKDLMSAHDDDGYRDVGGGLSHYDRYVRALNHAVLRASVLRRSLALLRRTPSAADSDDEAQQLVARAARPWSPATHELFPNGARAAATLARQVGRKLREHGAPWQWLPLEVWEGHVVPAAVTRETTLPVERG